MEIAYNQALFNSLYDEYCPNGGFRDWTKKIYQLVDYPKVKELTAPRRFSFVLYCLDEIASYYHHLPCFKDDLQAINHHILSHKNFERKCFAVELMQQICRSKFSLQEDEIEFILTVCDEVMHCMIEQSKMSEVYAYKELLNNFSISFLFRQLENLAREKGVSDTLKKKLAESWFNKGVLTDNYSSKLVDIVNNFLRRLFSQPAQEDQILPVVLDEADSFGRMINHFNQQATPEQRSSLYPLLAHYKKASGGQPSRKYVLESQKLLAQLGSPTAYIDIIKQWLGGLKQIEAKSQTHHYNASEYNYTTYSFLNPINAIIAKGIVWSLVGLVEQDTALVKLLGDVAEKSYQKIPGHGPGAAGVGNACLYVLAQSGMAGVGQLSRLKLRIKQANTQTLIQKYIQEESTRLGVSPQVIEDMAIADYGLIDGRLTQVFGDYQARITIAGVGKVDLGWFKADGMPLKSEPALVKKEFSTDLKILKTTVADIAKNTTAQRDRLDRSMLLDRRWTWQAFTDYYATHGLMSFLTQRLIWTVEKGDLAADIFYQNGAWVDLNGSVIEWLDTDVTVQLWHPVGKPVDTVISWREFLSKHDIRQPLKQAYREVYLLTDAELNTRLYSNRMAAHILKQHQFNTLAKGRGWRYSLLGAYDKGYESEKARIDLPTYGLKAEFWVSEVNADGAWNDTGIYLYVSTDQVRFTRLNDHDPLPLIDIPPLVFSEIMRDVDLFVGVASVGNDPNWRDGGLTQFRTYWESYSFGELGELAKSRKQAIERLLPRLKIARVATVRDKFLVVQGKLRTYKIHLGSGNILMEPNDQYLCIVPDRSSNKAANNIFLPFEGDGVLSIILSKAFLLSDDDKITDASITWQIRL